MIEKVNPKHPDKIADRMAGAITDLAYAIDKKGRVATEILIGHGEAHIIIETSLELDVNDIEVIVKRIAGDVEPNINIVPQDVELQSNQEEKTRSGDNGIFKGVPLTEEDKQMGIVAREIYEKHSYDGKYILDGSRLIICQSNATEEELLKDYPFAEVNPLGYWTGGTDVDTGATNRKLGSDMAHSVTGGGLHGKDLSKADVSVNIYAFLKAQEENEVVEITAAIGDEVIDGKPYDEIVKIADEYIQELGGFEKFAEWGLF